MNYSKQKYDLLIHKWLTAEQYEGMNIIGQNICIIDYWLRKNGFFVVIM